MVCLREGCRGNGKLRGLGSVIFGNETAKSCTPHQPAHLRFCSSSVKSPNRMKLRASGRPSIVLKSRPHPSTSSSSLLLTLAPHETDLFILPPSLALFSSCPLARHFFPPIYTSHLPCLVQPHVTSLSLSTTCLTVDLRPSHPPGRHHTTFRCF